MGYRARGRDLVDLLGGTTFRVGRNLSKAYSLLSSLPTFANKETQTQGVLASDRKKME